MIHILVLEKEGTAQENFVGQICLGVSYLMSGCPLGNLLQSLGTREIEI